ncbi:GNAT family N-acetyltransferase [Agromyces sp. NPDC058484]|uniref:GNAT family N-acetyltransferase n=1 Tax=Agromyces sp. NPDC058484 TaxID=3346524 RepID=UPI003648ADF4
MAATTRLLSIDDAPRLAQLQADGREFFAPWDPVRENSHYTTEGQAEVIRRVRADHGRGVALPQVILDEAGDVVGRVTLNGIVRGPFQSCSVGYWVAPEANGRGYATDALRAITALAFGDLGLHRVQAETLRHNQWSQRVLARVGFRPIGMAPRYLKIAGEWQDHDLFQLLVEE